jgi:nuclear pore complex protein Nup107
MASAFVSHCRLSAGPLAHPQRSQAHGRLSDDMEAEGTPDDISALEATYQSSAIHFGPEVEAFARAVDKYITTEGSLSERKGNIFQLANAFCDIARQRLETARRRAHSRRAGQHDRAASEMELDEDEGSDLGAGEQALKSLRDEVQTWDLLRRLLPLRYRESKAVASQGVHQGASQSRNDYWNDFLQSDNLARERKVVLEWLQTSAQDGPSIDDLVQELQENADRGDIVENGWLHTRLKLKQQKRANGWSGAVDPDVPEFEQAHMTNTTMITQLDPDAVTRQGRQLEPQDEYFERAVWVGCFEMLRRGSDLSEIRDWCSDRAEVWRAAALGGLPMSTSQDEDIEGFEPASVILWRRTCHALARQGGVDDYERAVFGLLAGDILSVEQVCQTWDDFIFTHYSALLRTQFDTYLIRQGGDKAEAAAAALPAVNAVQMHGDPVTVARRLIANLESNVKTRDEALSSIKALQGAIVANDLDRHLFQQGIVLSKDANEIEPSKLMPDYGLTAPEVASKYFKLQNHDQLRILAHIFIMISTLDHLSGAQKEIGTTGPLFIRHRVQEHAIAGYVSFLRLANLEEMIPLYCTMLHGLRKYHTLSRNLIHIVDDDARAAQINLMFNLGIDITEFVTTQARMWLEDVKDQKAECIAKGGFRVLGATPSTKFGREIKPDFFGEDPELVDPEDELIIRSLEWMMMVEGLLAECAKFTVRAYKYFLSKSSSPDRHRWTHGLTGMAEQMHLRAARSLLDRLPFTTVIKAKTPVLVRDDASPDWFEDFEAAEFSDEFLEDNEVTKIELMVLVRNVWELECLVKSLDSMETIASCAEVTRDGNTSREIWQKATEEIKIAKAYMRPLLHDWLTTSFEDDPDFVDIREAYLPETVLTYISALHFVGTTVSRDNLLEAMELAAVIAEKGSDVAQLFVKVGRMKELVEAFASASKALAVISTDKKKGSATSSKKMREMGWTKELWTVKKPSSS